MEPYFKNKKRLNEEKTSAKRNVLNSRGDGNGNIVKGLFDTVLFSLDFKLRML